MMYLAGFDAAPLVQLLSRYGITTQLLEAAAPIPGSYWGEQEAGLQGACLFARLDTPLHSVLHEAAHFVCMSEARRAGLDRDAGGDDAEEAAVCYLQVLLAEQLPHVGRARLLADMDGWGYSFRLGSAARWFAVDAEEACEWLQHHGIVDAAGRLTGKRRN